MSHWHISSTQYYIPDILAAWPWKRLINPMLAEVNDDANAWVSSLDLLEPSQAETFFAYQFNLAGALIGPRLESKDHLRILCYLMNVYFLIDEYTDIANKPEATKIANDIMSIFKRKKVGDQLSSGNAKMTKMAREFFQLIDNEFWKPEDLPSIDRFVFEFDAYIKAVVVEADDRSTSHLRTFNDYIALRRDTCAAKSIFACIGLGLNIPDVVFDNPIMISLIDDAADVIGIVNDIHSYRFERSRGLGGHNVITVVMEEHHLDLQQALYWLAGYASRIIGNFLANRRALPSWGEKIDEAVAEHIEQIVRCVRGTEDWHYETNRYYGDDGLKVQECRKMSLLPPGDYGFISRDQLELEIKVVA